MSTWNWYGKALEGQWGTTAARRVDWATDTLKVALVTTSYTPDPDVDDFWNDVSANEVATGSGYTTGGVTLGTKSVSLITATNKVALIAADPSWTGLTKAFRYGVCYADTAGASSTDPLLGYIDLGAQSLTASDFVIDCDQTNGLLSITYTIV